MADFRPQNADLGLSGLISGLRGQVLGLTASDLKFQTASGRELN